MNDICVDSGFLIGLYDEKDGFHEMAKNYFLRLFDRDHNRLVLPWPIVYETVSTRMVNNKQGMLLLERDWRRLSAQMRLHLLDDVPFRTEVIDECFNELRKPDDC